MRILVLGGTTEAAALADRLARDPGVRVILSLAGRTRNPAQRPRVMQRIGGFGGADGLARFLVEAGVDAVLDATHPFAAQISANAYAATQARVIPLCTLVRPPWTAEPGDNWHPVATLADAADALGEERRRVFLSVGRQGVGAFQRAPHHAYVIRSIERPDAQALPPDTTLVQARGPFALDDEIALLTSQRIDVVVSKNAGGSATYAKVESARKLGLPVIMIARPAKAGREFVVSAEEAIAWLERLHGSSRSERGV